MPPAPASHRPDLVQALLSQLRDYAIFFLDPDGIITDWYDGAEYIFGYSADEVVGHSFTRLFTAEDLGRGADRYELEAATSVGRSEDDRWHVRKDGTHIWGSGISLALRGPGHELIGFAKLVRDRTDLKAQTEALDRERAALQRKDAHIATFLAILGHELRNPLAPMANAIELLRRADRDPAIMDQAFLVLDRQMAVMSRLVEDVMEMTRAASGKIEIKRDRVDLLDVAKAVVHAARPQAEERAQALGFVAVNGPVHVEGDTDRLQQVFANLVNNAIKYTPRGGEIVVNVATEGGDAVVRVEDNGIGMDATVLPHIFELFTQENPSREASGGGLGLGLPLVRELVQAHGGTVQARSNGRGKGSVFTVRLPIVDSSQA